MTTKEVLTQARDLIADKDAWTQGSLAADNDGRAVDPKDRSAVSWCAEGAIERVVPRRGTKLERDAGALLRGASGRVCASAFNDSKPHRSVIALFNRAIKAA